jgi:S-adenosylmethionine decarboxylase proenzyme
MLVPSKPHILVDLYGCAPARLDDLEGLRTVLMTTARALGCTIVGDVFHQFAPHGVTGVLAIAESHISVHTWVEDGYAAVDLFLCSSGVDAERLSGAIESIAAFLGAERVSTHALERGAASPRPRFATASA